MAPSLSSAHVTSILVYPQGRLRAGRDITKEHSTERLAHDSLVQGGGCCHGSSNEARFKVAMRVREGARRIRWTRALNQVHGLRVKANRRNLAKVDCRRPCFGARVTSRQSAIRNPQTTNRNRTDLTARPSGAARLPARMPLDPDAEQRKLPGKIVLGEPEWLFEKAA